MEDPYLPQTRPGVNQSRRTTPDDSGYGPVQRAKVSYLASPSDGYDQEVYRLIPKGDEKVIQRQLDQLETNNPYLASVYRRVMTMPNFQNMLKDYYSKGKHYNTTDFQFASQLGINPTDLISIMELIREVPSLAGYITTPEEDTYISQYSVSGVRPTTTEDRVDLVTAYGTYPRTFIQSRQTPIYNVNRLSIPAFSFKNGRKINYINLYK